MGDLLCVFIPSALYQLITSKVPFLFYQLITSLVSSVVLASPPATGGSLSYRIAHFSFGQLEWLEVCVLGIITIKWKDFLFLMTAFFWGGVGVNYSNSFMFSVLLIKFLASTSGFPFKIAPVLFWKASCWLLVCQCSSESVASKTDLQPPRFGLAPSKCLELAGGRRGGAEDT